MLAAEGLNEEPGEDRGAKALRTRMEAERGTAPREQVMAAIQRYWITRGTGIDSSGSAERRVPYRHHLAAAREIAHELGINANEITDDLMKEVEETIGQAQALVQQTINALRETSLSEQEIISSFQRKKIIAVLGKKLERDPLWQQIAADLRDDLLQQELDSHVRGM